MRSPFIIVGTLASAALFVGIVFAQTIAEINGNKFITPYDGQHVTNVKGLVTAIGSNGIWMRSTTPDANPTTSESIFVFASSLAKNVEIGDIISIDGDVQKYRSDDSYLYSNEISNPSNLNVMSSNNDVTPVILGQVVGASSPVGQKSLVPPTTQYTSLDKKNVFGVPNNRTLVSQANPKLRPAQYGLDFWKSLEGELVTVKNPVVLDVPNSFGDTWIVGDWPATGTNGRGGLTITPKDGNPEAILIQNPLDGSRNRLDTKLGDNLDTITGVIQLAFGSFTIRPRTAITVTSSQTPALPPATRLKQTGGCAGLTISDYNVDNLTPNDDLRNRLANQIVNYLKSPTILFLQEIQDNDGSTDDGVTNANQTIGNLVDAIATAGGPSYDFAQIDPLNDSTGGEPGGNIRNVYLYNSKHVSLYNVNPGGATQANKVVKGPHLKYNPGLIAPNNPAFNDSRRPLVAEWKTKNSQNTFFTVNIHATSKGGSSSLFGDARPPVNLGVDQRNSEARATAKFIKSILAKDSNARIIAAGDWNEFAFVEPQLDFVKVSGLDDLDKVIGTTPVERYTYLFGQNSQALIHFYLSPSIQNSGPKLDRVHVNTWSSFSNRVSDHDPDVAKLNVC